MNCLVIVSRVYILITPYYSLKNNTNLRSAKYFRIINEIPTIILILVVFIVFLNQSRVEITLRVYILIKSI